MLQVNILQKDKGKRWLSKDQQAGYQESVSTPAPNVWRLELLTELNVPVCKSSEISRKQHKVCFQHHETLLELTSRLSSNVCWHWYYQEAEEFSRTKKHWQAKQRCYLRCIFLNMDKNIRKMPFFIFRLHIIVFLIIIRKSQKAAITLFFSYQKWTHFKWTIPQM